MNLQAPLSPDAAAWQATKERFSARRLAASGLVLGVLAELLFDGKRLGLSAPIFFASAVCALRLAAGRERWQQAGPMRWLLVPLGGFATMLAIRDSALLSWLNVMACGGLALLCCALFTGQQRLSQLSGGAVLMGSAKAALRGLAAGPVTYSKVLEREQVAGLASRIIGPAFRAAFFTVPVLAVFTGLLMVGDLGFADALFELIDLENWGQLAGRSIVVGGAAMVCTGLLTHALRNATEATSAVASGPLRLMDAVVPVLALSGLFGTFGLLRLTKLVHFDKLVAASERDFTYSNEAHINFGALMAVVVLTLLLLLALARLTNLRTAGEQRVLAVSSSVLVALTLPIAAASLWRLALYARMYGLTELRVAASWAVCVSVGLLLVRAATMFTNRFTYGAGALTWLVVALGALNALNPDAFIAQQNLTRHQEVVALDELHLLELSADAAPSVVEHFTASNQLTELEPYLARFRADEALASWRWSRAQARRLAP